MAFHKVLLPFFLHLCMMNLVTNIYASTIHSLSHQQFMLLNMKQTLVFNPAKSKKLVQWDQRVDCCRWSGVSCNKGRVIGLDLSHESISGDLDNSSLFNLQHLHSLNLAYNDFGSLVPSKIDKLKNLRHLNLSNAGFYGQIPNEVSHLTKLSTLDLSTSLASKHTLKLEKPNIGMFMQNLTQITELYLDGVRVSAFGKEWCQAFSSLQKLQVLSMSSCNLSGPIDSSLAKLNSLQVIRLNLNNMSSSVPESFANFSNLTILQLSSCGLNGIFPKGIFQIQTLKVLDVSDNEYLQGSLPDFPQDGSLDTLNLSNTNFSGQLVSAISNLKQLSTLDLSHCQLNGTLPISLSKLTQLIHLDLSFNKFTGPLPSFNKSKNLTYLSFFQNELIGAILPTHWEGLSNLRKVNLGDNSFSGKIPTNLFTLPCLQELTLSHNGFDGLLDEFPNATFSSLELVDLSINKLEGPIPVSFFHIKRLGLLNLSLNKFNGTIQLDMIRKQLPYLGVLGLSHNNLLVDTTTNDDPGFSSFPNLVHLLLASCKLREFPSFLRNQSQLLALDLSNNQIQGTIPNWIWRIDSLISLNLSNNLFIDLEGPFENLTSNILMIDLHSNQIHGSVPFFSKYAVHLDYSNNRFNFISPNIWKFLGFTYFLSLSNNSFHGKIHESFCNYSTLRLLDLSYNNFDGIIPECLTTRSSTLRVLNLARNKLSGHISDTISSSCSLRVLDLNANQLGGTIPKSLTYCKRLEVLNLGNNLLSDEFPCFLRNISTLRVLILRSNKLHSPIRCTHGRSNWEMLHIVDLAFNNFTGTLPGKLLQSWTAMTADGNETRENITDLFFDMYDFHHSVRYKDMLSSLDNVLVKKLAKIFGPMPSSAVETMFSFHVNANQLPFGGTYLDSVTVVNKGLQMKLVKILSVFTCLDFSSNHFVGPIPEELMSLKALNVLNLSHNTFSGHIPSSLGNLIELESLDLSNNTLAGEIPTEISSLSFLSVLNLSFNHLAGKIPTGTQIQSFDTYSFKGNEGLCGPPLTKNCNDDGVEGLPPTPSTTSESHNSIDWNFLSAELGFTFGFGFIILPLIFWKRWRLWYSKHMDDLLWRIFPQLDFVYEQHGEHKYRILRWRPT